MYYDEETNLYYQTKRDCDKIKLWTRINQGALAPIPGFSRYTVTREGDVINIQRGTFIKPHSNGHRLAVSLVDDTGRQRALSLGRLVANQFIPIPQDDQYYDVVFDDNNPQNVHIDNLRWEPRWKRHANPDNYNVDIS